DPGRHARPAAFRRRRALRLLLLLLPGRLARGRLVAGVGLVPRAVAGGQRLAAPFQRLATLAARTGARPALGAGATAAPLRVTRHVRSPSAVRAACPRWRYRPP